MSTFPAISESIAPPTGRRLLAAATASLCFSLAGIGLGLALADLASVSARAWMAGWEEQQHVGDPESWDKAHDRLKLAHRLNPLNADYSADLGRLMEWRSWQELSDGSNGLKYRAEADRFYGETIGKRPSWGFAWAHYAQNRLLAGKRDDEFRRALKNAMLLAPWEPGVQRKVAWMGMATWDDLPPPMRVMVEENLRRALTLESDLESLIRLAAHYGWLDRLKPMMRTERQSAAFNRVLEQRERH